MNGKRQIKRVSKFIWKRFIILGPILLFGNSAFAIESVSGCENLKCSLKAAKAAETAKKTEIVEKIRATALVTALGTKVCEKAMEEFKAYSPNIKNKKIAILLLACGAVSGWLANDIRKGY